jgi:hypothetical protein
MNDLLVFLSLVCWIAAVVSGRAALAVDRRLRDLVPTSVGRHWWLRATRQSESRLVQLAILGMHLLPIRWLSAPTSYAARLRRRFYTYALITWCCGAMAIVVALEVLV